MAEQELFRARSVTLSSGRRPGLSGLDLTVFRGEILGLCSLPGPGREALCALLAGRRRPERGSVFYRGVPAAGMAGEGLRTVGVGAGSMVPDLSVWENLLVLRPGGQALRTLDARGLCRGLEMLLHEYGIPAAPEAVFGTLPPVMRLALELLRARTLEAEAAFAAAPLPEGTAAETEHLRALMRRLAGEGMTILIADHRGRLLNTLADRIAFFSGGTVVKTARAGAEAAHILAVLHPGEQPTRRIRGGGTAPRAAALLSLPDGRELPLYAGEVAAVHAVEPDSVERIAAGVRGAEAICVRPGFADTVLRPLSPAENLGLGWMERLGLSGVRRRETESVLLRAFSAWYGDEGPAAARSCRGLSRRECAAIALYRLVLRRPGVLLFADVLRELDDSDRTLVLRAADALAADGCAVCFIDLDTGERLEGADRSYSADAEKGDKEK